MGRHTKNLVILFALVVVIAAAGATVEAAPVVEEGGGSTPATLLQAAPDCEPPVTEDGAADGLESLLQPEPSPRFLKCGTCSDSACQGRSLTDICGIGGSGWYKFCGDGGFCSGTTTYNCRCSTGPPL